MPDADAPKPRLYHDLARLWPVLSPPSDYAAEADRLWRLIQQHPGTPRDRRPTLLELGAGGGHTLYHLKAHCDCLAVDLSEPMLANCRALNPEVQTIQADMRDARLNRTFDVVLVHDAIDYLTTAEDVAATMQTIAAHLAPKTPGKLPGAGGLACIAPTYTRETFTDGEVADDGTTTDREDLTYFTYVHDPDPADSTFEMILLYLIRDHDTRRVTVEEDRHTCGLFSAEQWVSFIEHAGLAAQAHEQAPPGADLAGAWSLFTATGE